MTFDFVKSKIGDVEILESSKPVNGYTDGEKIYVLFHELSHFYLHFGDDRDKLSRNLCKFEAEYISFKVSSILGISNVKSKENMSELAEDINPDLIKARNNILINTVSMFIDRLGLGENGD